MKTSVLRRSPLTRVVAFGVMLVGALLLLAACSGPEGPPGAPGQPGQPGQAGQPGSPGAAALAPPGEGLKATISKVDIGADGAVTVAYTLTDDNGAPVSRSQLDANSERFSIATIDVDAQSGHTQWLSYVLGDVKGAPYTFNGQEVQPALAEVKGAPTSAADSAGEFKEIASGQYTYTLKTVLPGDYDKNATHRVFYQATRDTREHVTNATFDFVPAGGEVEVTRQVVTTESCNQCHDPLALHGGSRIDTKGCVVCHTSQNIDPESGNTVELKVMVHKIHRGVNLPSVVAGGDYNIVGFRQSVHDFSKVVFPQFGGNNGSTIGEVRNCTTCHGAPPVTAGFPGIERMSAEDYAKLAPDADNWKNKPSRAACGACHDNIDWATGKSAIAGKRDHPGGPQTNDSACATCHVADSGNEFDASVVGAHTIPAESKQLKGINVDMVRVTNAAPGQNPVVIFTAKDNAGNGLSISDITRLTFNVAGPTTDYLNPVMTENAVLSDVVTGADGNYAYTLVNRAIPADAEGTWAIGMEARRTEAITGNEGATTNVTGASYNPVVYVPVTDKAAVPRRQVVSTENCNACHKKIAFHGGGRLNTSEYCQFCHNPNNVDAPQNVPARLGGPIDAPKQSINFKFLIHRVHTGEELTRDFTIYRSFGIFNFNEVEFPGDRQNCAKCHVGDSYTLPLPETAANTVAPREFYSPLGPAAAACLGCHDSKTASAHAKTMTDDVIGEACANCHGRGKELAVEKVHAR